MDLEFAEVVFSDSYREVDGADPSGFCFYCGKDLSGRDPKFYVHVAKGGSHFVNARKALTGEYESGDMGFFPIGRGCWRKIPKGFVFKARDVFRK